MADFQTRPLDETTWPDFARLIEAHYGLRGGCWCMAFHAEGVGRTSAQNRSEKGASRPGGTGPRRPRVRRSGLRRLVPVRAHRRAAAHQAPAHLPGRSRRPAELAHHVLLRRPEVPGRRVAGAALEGALREIARLGGGKVEGYPEDVAGRKVSGAFLNNGTVSMFERQGFARTRRLGEHHWVVARVVA